MERVGEKNGEKGRGKRERGERRTIRNMGKGEGRRGEEKPSKGRGKGEKR